jgi:uncharacterized protein
MRVVTHETKRVHFRVVGTSVLVMDRWNGRWACIRRSDADALDAPDAQDAESPVVLALKEAGIWGEVRAAPCELSTLVLKLTKACNYACAYCYDREYDDSMGHMSDELAWAAVEEAVRISGRSAPDSPDLVVILHGGEPMIRFSTIKYVVVKTERLASDLGKTVKFVGQTNLSLLDDDVVDFSIRHSIGWGVSLDGPPAINDRCRADKQGGGTYAAYQAARERYPDFVSKAPVLTTVTRRNVDAILLIARYFRDLGVPGWDWSLFEPIGLGRDRIAEHSFTTPQIIGAWNSLFDAVATGEFDGFLVEPVNDYLRNFVMGSTGNMCMREKCGATRDLLSVRHDGIIDACDCIDRRGPYAHLGRVTLDNLSGLTNARNGDKANLIRSRDVRTGCCGECTWLSVCGGTCLAHADSLHGVWRQQCLLSMNAFDRIAVSIGSSSALRRYWDSLCPGATARLPTVQVSSARVGC